MRHPGSGIRRAASNHWIFFRVIGAPFLRSLVVPIGVVLLSVAMADASVDWAALRSRIGSLGPWQQATVVTGLVLAWSLVAGRALRPVWRQPVVAFLIRQPLTPGQWACYVSPSIGTAMIVVAGIAWLAPRNVNGLVHYLCFVALALPIVLGASFARRDSLAVIAAGTIVLFAFVLAYAHVPATAYAALLLAVLGSRFPVLPIRRQIVSVNRLVHRSASGSGVVGAIVRRDLLYLLRTQRMRLLDLALIGAGCALMMLAFRVNGEQAGSEALLSASLLFTVSISAVYNTLESLKIGLGKELMRRRWPVTNRQRALALFGLVSVLLGPGAIAILLIGSTMGPVNSLVYALFCSVALILSACLFSQSLIARTSASGSYLLLITLHMVLLLALPAWAYLLAAATFLPLGFYLTVRGFGTFTSTTERISIDQLA